MQVEHKQKGSYKTGAVRPQLAKLQQFFSKHISSLTILYRASEHDFSIVEFHRKCDGVDHTVVVVETDSGKVIGGYSTNAWKSDHEPIVDYAQESFLFSLTTGQKLHVTTPMNPIRNDPLAGPVFGHTDLYISDDANTCSSTSLYFPCDYGTCQSDKKQEHIANFSGVKQGYCIKIKDWEVYKIDF